MQNIPIVSQFKYLEQKKHPTNSWASQKNLKRKAISRVGRIDQMMRLISVVESKLQHESKIWNMNFVEETTGNILTAKLFRLS